ncbi:MAG TPA: cytochrome c [Stellaceae bacterium]|jgi:cytochrome c556|nr:cytochrome c [Stellaceae bacterium]
MAKFAKFGVAATAVGLALAFGTVAVVAQDKEAQIQLRRDTMKRQGKDLKAIQDFVKGQGDQANAEHAIADLQSIAPKIVGLFPPGTGMDAFPGKTGAKPAIWQQWDKFSAIPPTLQGEEAKLATAIKSGDKAAVGAALAGTGKNGCGACHTDYREKIS